MYASDNIIWRRKCKKKDEDMTISGNDVEEWLGGLSDDQLEERRKAALHRKARAEQTLARLGADERKRDTRRKIVIGGVVVALARRDQSFAAGLLNVLDRELLAPRDRLLVGLPTRDARTDEGDQS
jgi:hypothetical protein